MSDEQLAALTEYLRDYPEEDPEEIALSFLALNAESDAEPSGVWEDENLVGHYRVLREIGRGGQAVVHEAVDLGLGRRVALKILEASWTASPRLMSRFRREAEIASNLEHPGICTVFESGNWEERPFIAMQLVRGRTLGQLLERPHELDPVSLLSVFEKTCRALHVAHEAGVIHRDMKPGNIMVTPAGSPVILDFGLARPVDNIGPGLTRPGELVGTPAYMSPEQTLAIGKLDGRSDVFSIGTMMYETFTGRPPFEGWSIERLFESIRKDEPPAIDTLNPALGPDLAAVIRQAMAKDREDRYPSALALAEDLVRVRRRQPVSARRAGFVERLGRGMSRRPELAAALLGLLVVLFVGLGLSIYQHQQLVKEHARARRVIALTKLEILEDLDDSLWPAPRNAITGRRGIDDWIDIAESIQGEEADYREQLAQVEARLAHRPYRDKEKEDDDAWRREILREGIARIQGLPARLARMKDQRARLLDAASRSKDGDREAWESVRELLTRPRQRALYGPLLLGRQTDLVPLGADAGTGLLEFGHLRTGDAPRRQAEGDLRVTAASGMVLTLVPGKPPVFVSKWPVTRACWARVTGAPPPPLDASRPSLSLVSAERAARLMPRLGLRLPTVAELRAAVASGGLEGGSVDACWWAERGTSGVFRDGKVMPAAGESQREDVGLRLVRDLDAR